MRVTQCYPFLFASAHGDDKLLNAMDVYERQARDSYNKQRAARRRSVIARTLLCLIIAAWISSTALFTIAGNYGFAFLCFYSGLMYLSWCFVVGAFRVGGRG